MVAEADASPRPGDRDRHGISFGAWAFVIAGVCDGLAEEELLAHLGFDEVQWQLASAAFHEDVLDDVEAGGTLTEDFDEAMRAARKTWTRKIPPLDVDLQAWLDFYRAWMSDESPLEFLETHGLRPTDIHRLQDHWQVKLAENDALRKDALAMLQAPAGAVTAPRPEPPRLLATDAALEAADVTAAGRTRTAPPSLPFSKGAPAPAPPRLSVSLPKRAALRRGADETRAAVRADADGLALPFQAPQAEPEQPTHSPSAPEERRDDGEHVPLSIERYAALCVDLIEAPDAHGSVLMRYGITVPEKLALDVHWTQKMADDATLWLAWDRACAERRAGRME
jgi:hypothetical protein